MGIFITFVPAAVNRGRAGSLGGGCIDTDARGSTRAVYLYFRNKKDAMSAPKKILAIINPISGTKDKEELPALIDEVIDPSKYSVECRFTQYAGHAAEMTRQAVADGVDVVLSVGGDGTCNEIARELINTLTALAIVPVGSGNGLARHLGISMDARKALEIVNDGVIADLDYCTANGRPFFCTCGVGFDALVSLKFAEGKRRGKLAYVAKALTEYLKYKSETYQIEMPDGTVTEKAFLIACGNASQYGNNAYIAPHASMQDGKIDVTVLMPFTPFDTAGLALLLFTKHIDQDANIKSFTTESLVIKREKPGAMHLDGEPIEMGTRIDIRCFKGGLRALIPAEDPKRSIIEPFASVFWEFIETVRQELNI